MGAVCLVQSSIIQLKLTSHLIPYSLLVFFATLFIYNLQRVFYKPALEKVEISIRRKWIFKNQITLKLLILIGCIGGGISFFFIEHSIFFYLTPLLILSLLYFLPFIRLRKNPGLKLFTLVIVWSIVTALVPMLLDNVEVVSTQNSLHVLLRFCFLLGICIPFDIRDLEIDKAETVSTIPHLMGENKARWLAFGCMLVYIALIVLDFGMDFINPKIFLTLLLSAFINTGIVLMSNSKRSEYFYVAGVDGTMILQGILLLAIDYF